MDARLEHPVRPETNGVAERAVRRVKEGTSATLLQSGLTEYWWNEDRNTAFEKRFNQPFKGPIVPFGSQIEYKPSRDSDIQRLHQLGKKMLPGIFLGYVQHAGGGWTGDLIITDWQQIESADHRTHIHAKQFKSEEVKIVWKASPHCFPIAEGNLRLP